MGRGRGRGGKPPSPVFSLPVSRKEVGKKNISPAGNRTPVFRVTGGDTHHYTTEEVDLNGTQKDLIGAPWQLLNEKKRKKKAVPVRGIEPRPRR